jgi:hypothetical protein
LGNRAFLVAHRSRRLTSGDKDIPMIESGCRQFGSKEFLRSKLAPHQICKAKALHAYYAALYYGCRGLRSPTVIGGTGLNGLPQIDSAVCCGQSQRET